MADPDLNLNDAVIDNADGPAISIRSEHGQYLSTDGRIEVYFNLLPDRLCLEIARWPIVVGCVAWLTNHEILTALQHPGDVSILVNKEDFLRPDTPGTWHEQNVKARYQRLSGINRYDHPPVWHYNYASDPTTDAIRCVGIRKPRGEVPPRLHHKFLVFCQWEIRINNPRSAAVAIDEYAKPWISPGWGADEYEFEGGRTAIPKAVWTGSFNFSENGRRSLENAVIIRDQGVAGQFYAEWAALLGISEPLDWTTPYLEPEYRIGT